VVEVVTALAAPTAAHVITSDRGLAARVRDLGATVTGAGTFLERLDGY
jgi:predicted DNA-binding protein (UPF0278 family)